MMRAALALVLVLSVAVVGTAPAADEGGEALVAAVRAQRPQGSFRIRLYITRSGEDAGVNLLIKGQRSDAGETLVVTALSPAALRGEQVRLNVEQGKLVRFEQVDAAGAAQPLPAATLGDGVFGTDLSFDDLLGRAWSWPAVGVVGSSRILDHDCDIVELRPPQSDAIARLRSCIAADLGLPLLSERHDAQGRVVQRYRALALTRQQERWAVREFDVERPLRGSRSHARVVGAEIGS